MKTNNKKIGDLGENLAIRYLTKNNYNILEKNYRKTWGEIDIIARKNGKIIFFEVKTLCVLNNSCLFRPEEQITKSKEKRMKKIINTYLSEKKIYSQDFQIDIIAILINLEKKIFKLRHLKNVILN